MAMLPVCTAVNGYLFAAIGIATCFVVGYGASALLPRESHCLDGLTIHTMRRRRGITSDESLRSGPADLP